MRACCDRQANMLDDSRPNSFIGQLQEASINFVDIADIINDINNMPLTCAKAGTLAMSAGSDPLA
jgi:hypothetical protein